MSHEPRVNASFHPLPVAIGFATGCTLLGIGFRVVNVMSGDVVPDDEGGALAHIGYAVLGYGVLALSGAIGTAIVGLGLRRWLHRWPASVAWMIGIATGAVVAAIGGLGLLRHWMPFALGRATLLVQGLTLGAATALVVFGIGATRRRARS